MCTACKHETPKGMAYDHSICLDCYSIFTDTRWGVASLKWFRNRDAAEFYRATGRYPDGDDPRDAEISSLTARVEELERALANLTAAAQQLSGTKFDTYKKRNGHQASIEADDGEKCWIVHSDEIFHLEDASKRARTTLSASDTRDEATP